MKTKMVRMPFDLSKPPVITPEMAENLAHLDKIKDEDIDLTEIPELDDNFFKNALGREDLLRLFRARKQSTTVRIDADVLHWLKKDGKGYQSRLNAILRKEMTLSVAAEKAPARAARTKRAATVRSAAAPARRQKLSA